jgi:hypothetical protein
MEACVFVMVLMIEKNCWNGVSECDGARMDDEGDGDDDVMLVT